MDQMTDRHGKRIQNRFVTSGLVQRTRPSTAMLKRELRDPKTPKKRRMEIWTFLQYRKKYTGGR